MRAISIAALAAYAVLAAGAAASPPAQEQPAMTAGDLHQLCAGSDHVSRNVCRSYILGVTQGMQIGLDIADGRIRAERPCVPEDTSAEKLESQVKPRLAEDLAASPASAGHDAARFIGGVLGRVFPCAHRTQPH